MTDAVKKQVPSFSIYNKPPEKPVTNREFLDRMSQIIRGDIKSSLKVNFIETPRSTNTDD